MTQTSALDPACQPESIEARSFEIIEAELLPLPFSGAAWQVARRIIHSAGDLEIAQQLVLPDAAVAAGVAALRKGCIIYTDTEMARQGMTARHLAPLGTTVRCLLQGDAVARYAHEHQTTRSRAGILLNAEHFAGNLLAIGNAPTALLALIEALEAGCPRPALIIAMPVGFVNAAESKELLARHPNMPPALILRGRKGGSSLAAACVNALAILARA